jgi:iron complex outermembrane receptor protein
MRKIILSIFTLISISTYSQTDTSKVVQLENVSVMGIRSDRKTPISQKIVTKKQIERTYQGQEVPILIMEKTPSVTSYMDGGHPQGYTYFRLRGIDQTRINMTLDGVPLNEPEDQGVYTSNYPGFTNFIQSMQVQRGVGTSTNGVASYGGSINFVTKSGFEKESEIALGYGSFNTMRFNFSNGTGLSKKNFALYTNLSLYQTDGYRYNSGGDGGSIFISGGKYGDKDIIKFSAFSGISRNGMAWLGVSEEDIKIDKKTNYNQNDAWDDFRQTFTQGKWIRKINSKSKFSTGLFYNRLDGSYDYFMSGNRSLFLGSNFFGLINNYQYKSKNFKFDAGLNINTYNRDHKNIEADYKNKGFRNELSIFSKLSYDISKFTLFTDLQYRYSDFSYEGDVSMDKLKWNFFNPKFGIVYNKNSYMNYYFSIGKTGREPTRTNLFGGSDNLTTLENVSPESVIDYELGFNRRLEKSNIQANLYYMDFENEITLLGAIGTNSLPLMTNVSKSFRSGIELDYTRTSAFDIMSTTTTINYSFNRIIDGDTKFQPLYTPDLIISQSLGFNFHKIFLEGNFRYNSKSYISLDNKYSIPDFVVFGANVRYDYKKWSVLGQLNNIFSNNYYTMGYVVDNVKYLYTNAPVSFYITIKRKI